MTSMTTATTIAPKMDREYWAQTADPKRLAQHMRARIDRFRQSCDTTGIRNMWAQSLRLFYGLDPTGGFRSSHWVQLEGPQGADVTYRINDYRAIANRQIVMTTGSRPMFELTARAYDAETTEQIEVGTAFIDRVLNDGVEASAHTAAKWMITAAEGWLATTWDDLAGDVVVTEAVIDPLTGTELYPESVEPKGSIRVLALRGDQVIRDPDVKLGIDTNSNGGTGHRWVILQVQRSKWELAQAFPDYAQEILRANDQGDDWLWKGMRGGSGQVNFDMVTTYELYHARTLNMPEGLQVIMCGDCVITSRRPLQYSRLPVSLAIADRPPDASFGYAPSWDLMAPQIAKDSIVSQLATTRENFGRSWIWAPPNTDFDAQNLSGSKVITSTQPPQVLDVSNGGVASGMTMLDSLDKSMAMQAGMDAQANAATSGEMLALQQQQSAQYNSQLQFGWFAAYKGMLEMLLEVVQKFMTEEQLVQISGKNNAPIVKRFKGSDLRDLAGIKVDMGTTAMRTASFRYQVAQNLLTAQAINVEQYLAMISTGRYQPALEAPRVLETMCERRMQTITDGGTYMPLATDPHELLIARLATLLCDPEMEQRVPEIMPLLQQHDTLWLNMTLTPEGMGLLAATGQSPHPGAQLVQQMRAEQAALAAQQGPQAPQPGANPEQPANMQNAPAAPNDGAMAGANVANMPAAAEAPSI